MSKTTLEIRRDYFIAKTVINIIAASNHPTKSSYDTNLIIDSFNSSHDAKRNQI